MSVDNKTVASTSFPTFSILGIVFVVLKLTDQIDWAWKWVLAPFWIPWALALAILFIAAAVFVVVKGKD